MRRRVVITGTGTVTALGLGSSSLWDALDQGRSGIAPISLFDHAPFPTHFACEVKGPSGLAKDFSARDFVPKNYRKATKVMARDIELAVAAAKLAVEDAKLTTRATLPEGDSASTYPSERFGCHVGAGLLTAETEEISLAMAKARDPDASPERLRRSNGFSLQRWGSGDAGGHGMDNLTPLWMLKYLPNMLACHVTIIHGAEGPSNTITCAEASALLSIGESMRVIARGAADACYAGGAESKVSLMGLMRMHLAGRLAHAAASDDPAPLCRPYAPDSRGGILGEAGGILVLEEESLALKRGASTYARLAGFGAAQSPPPCIPPHHDSFPSSQGLERAIRAALRDADASPAHIDAIVPQASGVTPTDHAEASALRAVFGSRADSIPLLTLPPAIGDCAAGNGGVHAALAALAIRNARLPRHHVRSLSGEPPRSPSPIRRILVCTSGMGGQNAALILEPA